MDDETTHGRKRIASSSTSSGIRALTFLITTMARPAENVVVRADNHERWLKQARSQVGPPFIAVIGAQCGPP